MKQIQVIEVGPRDGFQNVKEFIPTPIKQKIIDGIVQAGIRSMEITSFVHPKAIPQMVDASEIAEYVSKTYPDLRTFALVPNLKGAQNAVAAGLKEVSCVISASEAHNKANINQTKEDSIKGLWVIRKEFPDLKIRLDVATAFGCPFTGDVPLDDVLQLIDQAIEIGINGIVLCDTIGVANPPQVGELAAKVMGYKLPVAVHLHNTRGLGLANTLAAIQSGITSFETSVGGLGGCPFAPGAAGNTATEDMVNMLSAMGFATGVDEDNYLDVVRFVSENIPAKLSGSMLNACKYPLKKTDLEC